jgi:GNAT superfamily N-acetyltransferase
MLFEEEYEDELKEDFGAKTHLMACGTCIWLRVGGLLVGEILGCAPMYLSGVIPDVDCYDVHSYYVFSTTILKPYQGRGYGKLLKAYTLGLLRTTTYTFMIGHATTPRAVKLNEDFGATFYPDKVHKDWYGSKRVAHFYSIPIRRDA